MINTDSLIKKRLSKTRFIGRMLARLPFVECVILNGSLAQDKSKKSSDIDILIIAKDGRIFTSRFFINTFALLFGIKRSKDGSKSHAGKFCFNYFLTESYLKVPTGRGEKIDQYCAENYSSSKFIAGDGVLFLKFLKTNKKLFEFYGYKILNPKSEIKNKSKIINSKFKILQQFRELLLGDWFEQKVRSYQIKRIESDPRTKKYPDLIVHNDKELRFHPPKQS